MENPVYERVLAWSAAERGSIKFSAYDREADALFMLGACSMDTDENSRVFFWIDRKDEHVVDSRRYGIEADADSPDYNKLLSSSVRNAVAKNLLTLDGFGLAKVMINGNKIQSVRIAEGDGYSDNAMSTTEFSEHIGALELVEHTFSVVKAKPRPDISEIISAMKPIPGCVFA